MLLGSIGLAALLGWLDYLLIPALLFFIGLTLYASSRRDGKTGRERGCE
ncbi:hypothetical protein Rifp1Sym_bf00150 [endosymbiont of Riftia pachyptila (vent Ph05)]|uniref:Uncharacterized protein n=1 Tax=endosymbiont of Riftia pachyptila (vent Ph05) TaxID=1048808 RepID=G2DCV6_9GAMM|nr:hypothetical protein Rifp1Sym_bf00150 [endosymbiont of Riftia pachyptila (vent Ph05)]